ncbi:MAG TPA: hypothetical protein VFZ09_48550 [Archangium sp.]|uniref:hypothetical protein n=1 Tax=Archangium sp. TaxID=1872627 RepID=UPI002E328387|nr:hypothetical protein [Archangium sp.]HEX5754128.1 hypothetical protein [Archangium sp.]
MNTTRAQLSAVLAALSLCVAGTAHAQTPAAPPPVDTGAARAPEVPPPSERPAPPAPPPPESRAHVRSSHTVDVIAPGEQVDTVLGRMRVERTAPPPRGDTAGPPPGQEPRGPRGQEPRGPRGQETRGPPAGPGRSGPPRPGDDGRGRHTSPRTDGARPPPSSQPPPPPPR